MRILILYTLRQKKFRKTITEHLYSFKKYAPENEYVYVNVGTKGIPSYLHQIDFDAVILHYTILAGERFLPGKAWETKIKGLNRLTGYKIAIPQDEYCYTGRLVDLFKEISIDVVCTCFYKKEDIHFAYAQYLPDKVKYIPVFTGYVDENSIQDLASKATAYSDRPIDIGYRASMLPAHLGKHGQLKYELIGEFNDRLKNSNLVLDIRSSNDTLTNEDRTAVKLGNEWEKFLLDCKAFIGCEGGSSLLDFDGSIQGKVYTYSYKHPSAKFEEIANSCFPGMDYNISCFAISPRHFEAAITKTLQILVEGYYGGIFEAGVHYLTLKKDFSNFDELISDLKDEEKCQNIINQAYKEIVLSGKYSYRSFVNQILATIKTDRGTSSETSKRTKSLIRMLNIRESFVDFVNKYYIPLNPYNFAYNKYKNYIKPHIKRRRV